MVNFHAKHPFACAIVGLGLVLGGCQTQGGLGDLGLNSSTTESSAEQTVSNAFYTPLYDQIDHLKDLVETQQSYDDAAKLVSEQSAFFENPEHQGKAAPLLSKLAERLNAPHAADLSSAVAALNKATWPADPGQWAEVRAALETARKARDGYPGIAFLRDPQYRASEMAELERNLDQLETHIKNDAPDQFRAYDHASGVSFFSAYPMPVDTAAVAGAGFDQMEADLRAQGSAEIGAFAKLYKPQFGSTSRWQKLSDMHMSALLRETPGGSGDLKSVLNVISKVKAAGFEPKTAGDVKIGVIEVTSTTLLQEHQIEFPASIDVDLPFDMSKAELDEALSKDRTGGLDFLIVFDVALAKTQRRVSSSRKMPSNIIVGYQKEPNPDYEVARMEVQHAQLNMQTVKIQNSTNRGGYYSTPGAALLGGLLEGIAAGAANSAAKQKLDQAMAALAATPQYIEKPVRQKYHYDLASVRATKLMTVHYYVIDLKRKRYLKSTFDVTEKKKFDVAYRVHSEDPERDSLRAKHDTEEDVTKWEEAASSVKLSQLIDNYLANSSKEKRLPSLVTLRKEMLSDRNTALLRYKEQTFEASTQNDPRFDSVVMILMPNGGLGSGFFVRPDVVMTNYHVVEEGKFVEMKLYGGQETFGKVIATDVQLDLALVKVQSRGKAVEFFSKRKLELGSTVEVIGHPKGYEFSISRGVVSAIRPMKSVNLQGGKDVLQVQIDAAISPGNSGGPVFFRDRVVSVVSWKRIDRGSENLNFAIHYSEAERFIRESLGAGS